ncbi:MAG: hypothetical protein ACFFF4_00385 [Candidatus Thorarchaeota archaeon]
MTSEVSLQDKTTIKQEIVRLISSNISAIHLVAEHLKVSDEVVSSLILELVEEGKLKGTISEDGLRFFRSDVKMPTISNEPVEEEQKGNPMFIIPKAIVTMGIAMFIAGQIFTRVFAQGTPLQETSAGLVLLGLIAIFGGLFSFTKFEERSNNLR